MIGGRIRASDVPRFLAYLLLVFPPLLASGADDDESIALLVGKFVLVALCGAAGSKLFFYDYPHSQRYGAAMVISWTVMGCLLLLAFRTSLDQSYLLVMVGCVFASFSVGVAIFCIIRQIIDATHPRGIPQPEYDDYTIAKVTTSFGWTLCGFSLLCITIDRGNSDEVDYPDSYYYYGTAVVGLISAILVSYYRSNWLAFLLAVPIGSVVSMHLASSELIREGDFSPLVVVAFVVGLLPGAAVFHLVNKLACLQANERRQERPPPTGAMSPVIPVRRSDYEMVMDGNDDTNFGESTSEKEEMGESEITHVVEMT